MNQKKKQTYILCLVLSLCLMLTSCGKRPAEVTWADGKPAPFGAYVYSRAGETSFLQLPIFFPGTVNEVSGAGISGLSLLGDGIELNCDPDTTPNLIIDEERGCTLLTLSFRVEPLAAGEYQVDRLRITLQSGEELNFDLGKMRFVAEENDDGEMPLELHSAWINQSEFDRLTVTYVNTTDQPVNILGLDFPGLTGITCSVECYMDVEMILSAQDTVIPPGEQRTVCFLLSGAGVDSLRETGFAFLNPRLSCQWEGQVLTMPMQKQPLVVQPPFTDEFVSGLLEQP